MAGAAADLGDAGPGRFGVVATVIFPAVAIDIAVHDRAGGLLDGNAGGAYVGVAVARNQRAHFAAGKLAMEAGEVSVVDLEAHVDVLVRLGCQQMVAVAVAGLAFQPALVVLVMGAGIGGVGEQDVGRRRYQLFLDDRRIAVAVIAGQAGGQGLEADAVGMAAHAVAVVVVGFPGHFRGAILVEAGPVMTDLTDIA